jgi:hypothetical protein
MARLSRYLLLAAVLLFAQQATQLHALTHDPGHVSAKCLSFHSADNAIAGQVFTAPASSSPGFGFSEPVFTLHLPPRIVFDSRAPPALS